MSFSLPHQQQQFEQCKLLLLKMPKYEGFSSLKPKTKSRVLIELHYFLQYLTINTNKCVKEADTIEVFKWLSEVESLSDYYYRQKTLSLIKDILPQVKWQRPRKRPILDRYYRLRDFSFWHFYESKKAKLSKDFFDSIKQKEIVDAELLCTPFYQALNEASPGHGQDGGFTESDEDIVKALKNESDTLANHQQLVIVDIACGAGRLLKRLSKEFPQAKLVGTSIFEFTPEEITSFKKNNIEAIYCEADRINLEDNIADIVVCSEVIEHLKNPSSLAVEIHRILKEDGVFCVTAPSKASYMYNTNPISYLSVLLSPYRGWFLPTFHNLYAPLSHIKFVHYGFTPKQFQEVFHHVFPKATILTTRFTSLKKFRLHLIAHKLPFFKYMGGLCMAVGTKVTKTK